MPWLDLHPHQYPTMAALSPGRRLALLELSRQRGFPIVEDDFDHEYHYDGRPLLPLASADSDGRVVYVGTLSKVLAPGLRIGYLVAARQLLERVAGFRGVLDHQGDAAWDGAIAELIEDGELQRHLSRTRRIYRARRDHVCALLDDRLGHVLDFDVPAGGMALWARARDGCDVERWERQGRERGVGFLSGRHYHFDGASQQFLRLGYACLNEAELTLGVERLEAALPRRRAQNGPSKRRSSP